MPVANVEIRRDGDRVIISLPEFYLTLTRDQAKDMAAKLVAVAGMRLIYVPDAEECHEDR